MRSRMPFSCITDERGAYLLRYAVIVAVLVVGCFVAFNTVGQEAVHRIWSLGQRIGGA
jgi:hypothetical protein